MLLSSLEYITTEGHGLPDNLMPRFYDRFSFNERGKFELGFLAATRFGENIWPRFEMAIQQFERKPYIVAIGGAWFSEGIIH